MFQSGYAEILGLMKIAQGSAIAPYEGSTWMPPGARPEKPWMRQGSEAAAHARKQGLGGKQPGLLGKMWSKFRKLPGKAQVGIGLGAAGLLGGAIAAARKSKKEPGSSYAYQDMRPELQAAQYAGQQAYLQPHQPAVRPQGSQVSPELRAYLQRRAVLA